MCLAREDNAQPFLSVRLCAFAAHRFASLLSQYRRGPPDCNPTTTSAPAVITTHLDIPQDIHGLWVIPNLYPYRSKTRRKRTHCTPEDVLLMESRRRRGFGRWRSPSGAWGKMCVFDFLHPPTQCRHTLSQQYRCDILILYLFLCLGRRSFPEHNSYYCALRGGTSAILRRSSRNLSVRRTFTGSVPSGAQGY